MNQTQRNYLSNRINNIMWEKREEVRQLCIIDKALTEEEKLDLIYSGAVSLVPRDQLPEYRSGVEDFFDFSNYVLESTYDKKKMEELQEKLEAEGRRVQDAVMLHDAEGVLEIVAAFENFVPK